jgi:hypothetical protein
VIRTEFLDVVATIRARLGGAAPAYDEYRAVSSIVRVTLAATLLLALAPVAQGQSRPPAVPPEVKKTVDAILGHWTMTGSSTDPWSETPSRVTGTMDCEPAAGAMAARCRVVNAVTGGGHIELATIVGYSPDDHRVHLMEAASDGSFHEHQGSWNGTVIEFERLVKSVGGQRVIEDFAVGFPSPGMMTIRSTEYQTEGRATLDLVGTKGAGPRR